VVKGQVSCRLRESTEEKKAYMTQELERKKRILLTGAAGRIGTAFRHHVGDRYHLRLGVHHLSKLTDPGDNEVVELEVADLGACQEACKDVDVVVHLAGSPSPRAEFYDTLLESNVKGSYNIFQAAYDQGCQRVVFSSSVQAVVGYPLDVQVHHDSPVRPLNMYGVCKCFTEALAHYYACAKGLSSIVVRVGTFESDWILRYPHARNLSTFVSRRDMCQLLVRCVERPDIQFAIVHGVSNNRFKFLDITSARDLLGYAPEDDAFKIFKVALEYSERWLEPSLCDGIFSRPPTKEDASDRDPSQSNA
jgi:nucleoside-diphosphate-sugar epimerase